MKSEINLCVNETLVNADEHSLNSYSSCFDKYSFSVSQFNEDWRMHINTYYYGYRSQKETYKEMGEVISFPLKKVQSAPKINGTDLAKVVTTKQSYDWTKNETNLVPKLPFAPVIATDFVC